MLIVAAVLLCVAPSAFAADRNFASRFSANDTGDVTMASNSLLTCATPAGACNTARNGPSSNSTSDDSLNNNAYNMGYIDADSDASTFDSSSANLTLPAGSTVLFAGLYWGGDYSGSGANGPPNAAARNKMKLKLPGGSSYTDITASVIDESALNVGRYQAFADVTSLVTSSGAGTYWGANVQTGTSSDHYAGWSLVVAYRDPTQPVRNLTIYDGLKTIRSSDPPTDITVSGLLTPPSGNVNSKVGMIAYEGDLGIVGDTASLKSNNTSFQTLSNGTNPANNFFNSSINTPTRGPSYVNNFGYDADAFSTTNVLGNNATSATLRLTTSGDQYLPGVIWFSTELYAPKVTETKTVTDLNGGEALPGDILEYTVTSSNSSAAGTDAATGFVLRDPIPNDTTYVPGSLKIAGAGRTDTSGDDTGEFDSAGNRIVARLGTGANATAGGRLAPGGSVTTTFQVKVGTPLPDDRLIHNTATASFFGETLGNPLTASASTTTRVGAPDLTLTKTRTSGPVVAGQPVAYDVAVKNVGDATTVGQVSVTDTLPAGLTITGASGTGWACTTSPPRTFTCTRSDGLAPAGSYPVIHITANTDPGLTGAVTNTATVSGGGDINFSNNSGSDTTAASHNADVSVTKSASPTTINVGDTSTFTIVVRNAGPSTATSVGLDDPIPNGLAQVGNASPSQGTCVAGIVTCNLGDIAPGGSVTVTVTVRATSAGAGHTITNTATAGSTGATDPTPGNNSASADVSVTSADLAVTKTLDPNPPVPGGPITYTIVAKNNGPSPATGVTVHDSIPAAMQGATVADAGGATCTIIGSDLNCSIGNLGVGATVTIKLTGTMAATSSSITNTASIQGAEVDLDPSNNESTVTGATSRADLSVTKTADVTQAGPGDLITYTLTVHNGGPDTAKQVTLSDPIPAGLTFVGSTPGTPTCSQASGVVSCTLGDIPNGETRTVTVQAKVDPAAPAPDHQHLLDVQRVQHDLTLAAGQTGSVDVPCPAGSFATDASVLILDNAGDVEDQIQPVAVAQNGDGYTVTVTNPTTQDNMQTRVSVVCVGYKTLADGTPPHQHSLLVSAPVSQSQTLAAGTSTVDLTCPAGQVAIAPSYSFSGAPVRVRGSFPQADNTGWRFVLDSSGAATAQLAIRCLDETTGETNGHAHQLALVEHDQTFTVPPHQTVTDRIECGGDGKGIVASYDLDPGLISLGNEPQPVNRDFRIENPTDAPLDARLDLLCLGGRTAGAPAIDRFVNTATVSSPTPDPDTDDLSDSATVTRVPVGAGPAGLHGSTLKVPISCDKRCNGKATVKTVGRVRAGGTTLRRHQALGKGAFKVRAHHRKSVRIGIGSRASKALRRAHVRYVLVNLRVAGRGSHTARVQLRTK